MITMCVMSSCSSNIECGNCFDDTLLAHSCPEPGHGPCYMCDQPELALK